MTFARKLIGSDASIRTDCDGGDVCDISDVTLGSGQRSSFLFVMSLLSQINVNDPDAGNKLVMAAAKSIEAKCEEQGTPITPFEEFCKQQEEKERKKKEAERQFIDIPIAENTEQISVPVENKITLSGKNKVDAAVIFLKAFLLRARLKSA